MFCATSKIHREYKLKKAFEQIIELSVRSVEQARGFVGDVEFSPEDGSRTELNYLVDITAAVIEAGATTINIPDTVGYAVPEEYGHIFSYVRQQLPVIDEKGIILSSHCHNDLGLAVANSLAAVQHGARQVECTINGIGERAGNAALEELVMALRTRADYYESYRVGIDAKKIFPTSRMVSNLTGLRVQRNKAIVGQNAFAHESGIHQDGMLKNRNTYEIMDPKAIGVPESKLVLGKHSGRHALADRVKALGYTVDEATIQRVYDGFKTLADKKKDVYDEGPGGAAGSAAGGRAGAVVAGQLSGRQRHEHDRHGHGHGDRRGGREPDRRGNRRRPAGRGVLGDPADHRGSRRRWTTTPPGP